MMATIGQKSKKFDIESDRLDYAFEFNPEETQALKARSYANLSIDDIRRIALWKLDRVVDVPDEVLETLRQLVIQKNLTARSPLAISALEALVQCQGVGYPMASAILKFIRPDVFPIIDVRAYRALTGKKISANQYKLDLYLGYVDQLLEIAKQRKVELAVVDEQLYCFDKVHNGKI